MSALIDTQTRKLRAQLLGAMVRREAGEPPPQRLHFRRSPSSTIRASRPRSTPRWSRSRAKTTSRSSGRAATADRRGDAVGLGGISGRARDRHGGRAIRNSVKDVIEEKLFDRRRDFFTDLSAVFMDTTSLSFFGRGRRDAGRAWVYLRDGGGSVGFALNMAKHFEWRAAKRLLNLRQEIVERHRRQVAVQPGQKNMAPPKPSTTTTDSRQRSTLTRAGGAFL